MNLPPQRISKSSQCRILGIWKPKGVYWVLKGFTKTICPYFCDYFRHRLFRMVYFSACGRYSKRSFSIRCCSCSIQVWGTCAFYVTFQDFFIVTLNWAFCKWRQISPALAATPNLLLEAFLVELLWIYTLLKTAYEWRTETVKSLTQEM